MDSYGSNTSGNRREFTDRTDLGNNQFDSTTGRSGYGQGQDQFSSGTTAGGFESGRRDRFDDTTTGMGNNSSLGSSGNTGRMGMGDSTTYGSDSRTTGTLGNSGYSDRSEFDNGMGGKPTMGDKLKGGVEQIAGKVMNKPAMETRGQERKMGEFERSEF
ncbi:Carbohydrate esterase family 4 protein [Mycena indigotica]|uniref:Carbohydrate esterase family 4 protein n=1 Tax=Mycena indigotica TaxID=2126181 RepID=A0A8H6SM81_9AGAR|nr:Carbohydrate esterase family 4 protein [Mycena indigotica]KAF7301211.1 Carbohydrate esterase family 4 protein [Mycena indigotica]